MGVEFGAKVGFLFALLQSHFGFGNGLFGDSELGGGSYKAFSGHAASDRFLGSETKNRFSFFFVVKALRHNVLMVSQKGFAQRRSEHKCRPIPGHLQFFNIRAKMILPWEARSALFLPKETL